MSETNKLIIVGSVVIVSLCFAGSVISVLGSPKSLGHKEETRVYNNVVFRWNNALDCYDIATSDKIYVVSRADTKVVYDAYSWTKFETTKYTSAMFNQVYESYNFTIALQFINQ